MVDNVITSISIQDTNKSNRNEFRLASDDSLEADARRKRSSSMDILAEAAVSSFSGQTSRSSTSDDEIESKVGSELKYFSTSTNADVSSSKKLHELSEMSTMTVTKICDFNSPLRRARGATFSYSPFTSKISKFEKSPSGSNNNTNPALSWLAMAADDEVNTAALLSGLSDIKVSIFINFWTRVCDDF
jgi:hypothetical protein